MNCPIVNKACFIMQAKEEVWEPSGSWDFQTLKFVVISSTWEYCQNLAQKSPKTALLSGFLTSPCKISHSSFEQVVVVLQCRNPAVILLNPSSDVFRMRFCEVNTCLTELITETF